MKFGAINADGLTRNYLNDYVTKKTIKALDHPYDIAFDTNGDLLISNQNTNVVIKINGSLRDSPGVAMPVAHSLITRFPNGVFMPGTLVPAFTAKIPTITPVPFNEGGLGTNNINSVRGITFDSVGRLYVSDEDNDRITIYDAMTDDNLGEITDTTLDKPVQLLYDATTKVIYIACIGSNSVLSYDPSTKKVSTFIHNTTIDKVSGMSFGEDGKFYAAERKSMSIYQFNPKGKLLKKFAGPFTDEPEDIMAVYE